MVKNKYEWNRWLSEGGWAYTGWILKVGIWYYADLRTVQLYKGFQTINGVEYYFDEDTGAMLVGEKVVDGKILTTDASGAVTVSEIAANIISAVQKRKPRISINGNWYYLNNRSQYIKYWVRIDGKMYYFMPGSEYAYEAYWGDINLDEVGIMCTGYRVINHKLYYFDQDGVCQGVCGPKDGWYNANGIWYFMKGGIVSTGMISVNGANYILGPDGKMYANSNGLRYVNADGVVVTTHGWLLTSDGYVYIQANGTVCTGVQVIDGVTYYFSANGILIA